MEMLTPSDPTALTTAALDREVAHLAELMEIKWAGIEKNADRRIAAIDNIPNMIAAAISHIPGLIKEEIGHLKELHQEKFNSVGTQFTALAVQNNMLSETNQKALDAALLSAAALNNQQNAGNVLAASVASDATTKQIDVIGTRIESSANNTGERINSLKEQIDRAGGVGLGAKETRTERGSVDSHRVAFAAMGIAGFSSITSLVSLLTLLLRK